MFRKSLLAVAAALGMAVAASGTAGAISNATPDTGGQYPYVGTFVLRIGEPGSYSYHYWCSGTLVAEGGAAATTAVAMVANGHCFDDAFQESFFPDSTLIGMTLEPEVPTTAPAAGTLLSGTGHIDARYPRYYDDVGVFVLDEPLAVGVVLPRLPDAGELTEMSASGDLVGTDATIVGYGTTRTATGGINGIDWAGGGVRQYASETITSLSDHYLHLQTIAARGQSGPCAGDSGAPRLLLGDTLLAAITGGSGGMLQAPETAIRLDQPQVLQFLHNYID